MAEHQERRRKKLIEPRLQMRFAFLFLSMAGIAALTQTIVLGYFLHDAASELRNDGLVLKQALPRIMASSFAITLLFLTPVMLSFGIRTTFRVVGPIYRFRMYLTEILRGGKPGPCKIRKGDELQDFCELINDVTAPLREEGEGSVGETDQGADDAGGDAGTFGRRQAG